MSEFKKRGIIKRTIKYTNKDGDEKNHYLTVGEFWSTDHGNRQALKIYATLNSDEQWLNIYPLEENSTSQNIETKDKVINSDNINDLLSDIPF